MEFSEVAMLAPPPTKSYQTRFDSLLLKHPASFMAATFSFLGLLLFSIASAYSTTIEGQQNNNVIYFRLFAELLTTNIPTIPTAIATAMFVLYVFSKSQVPCGACILVASGSFLSALIHVVQFAKLMSGYSSPDTNGLITSYSGMCSPVNADDPTYSLLCKSYSFALVGLGLIMLGQALLVASSIRAQIAFLKNPLETQLHKEDHFTLISAGICFFGLLLAGLSQASVPTDFIVQNLMTFDKDYFGVTLAIALAIAASQMKDRGVLFAAGVFSLVILQSFIGNFPQQFESCAFCISYVSGADIVASSCSALKTFLAGRMICLCGLGMLSGSAFYRRQKIYALD